MYLWFQPRRCQVCRATVRDGYKGVLYPTSLLASDCASHWNRRSLSTNRNGLAPISFDLQAHPTRYFLSAVMQHKPDEVDSHTLEVLLPVSLTTSGMIETQRSDWGILRTSCLSSFRSLAEDVDVKTMARCKIVALTRGGRRYRRCSILHRANLGNAMCAGRMLRAPLLCPCDRRC